MKLWLLRPVKNLAEGDNPWKPWYDKVFGFVIRASSEEEARQLANDDAEAENEGIATTATPWLDKKYSSCIEVLAMGKSEIIIRDFHAA